MTAFLDGEKLPDEALYLFNDSKAPLPLNIYQTDSLDYGKPLPFAMFQGYLIGTARARGANGIDYLAAYVGQASAKERYVLKLNLGGVGIADKTIIATGGIVINAISSQEAESAYSTSETEAALSKYGGHFVSFPLAVINITESGRTGNLLYRSLEDEKAQNAVAKAVMEFSKLTAKGPLDKVPVPSLIKGAIITDAADMSSADQAFAVSTVPLGLSMYFAKAS